MQGTRARGPQSPLSRGFAEAMVFKYHRGPVRVPLACNRTQHAGGVRTQ
jgi:hypothetical protein